MKNDYFKTFYLAFLAGLFSLMLFAVYFKLWQVNLNYPFVVPYGDYLGHVAIAKSIINDGWIADSTRFGYLNSKSFFTFDHYPLSAEYINFFIFKIFALFTDNPYLIVNLFYISTFFLISFFGFIGLKVFGISNLTSFFLAIYYAFLSYHFRKSVYHAFLSNYSCIPLIMMVVYWFYNNKINLIVKNHQQQYCFSINKYFIFTILIMIYCTGTGFYYASFSYLLLLLVWFLKSLKDSNFFSKDSAFFLYLALAIFVFNIYLLIPHFSFLQKYDFPSLNRPIQDSFTYSLKFVSLFIPNENHLIENFANIGLSWKDKIDGENLACYLGLLLGSVFITMLIWPIAKSNGYKIIEKTIAKFGLDNKDLEKINLISSLNFFSFLFVISGGLIALSFNVVFLRSNARFVVVMAFFCLIILGILVDGLKRKNFKDSKLFKLCLVLGYAISLLDMTGKPLIANYEIELYDKKFLNNDEYKNHQVKIYKNLSFKEYNSRTIKISDDNIKFVNDVESVMPKDSLVFIMPSMPWPENYCDSYSSIIFYIHSKKLRWSYPWIATKNNLEVNKKISSSTNFDEFISELKKLGFSGLVLNNFDYNLCLERNSKAIEIKNFKEKMIERGSKSLIKSDNGFFIFTKI